MNKVELETERWWLHPEEADQYGLVGCGGELLPGTVLLAYSEGVFPWFSGEQPVLWWSPDPRAIFEIDRFHVSRRLARKLRSGKWRITCNQSFEAVIRACGENRPEGTWINNRMITAFTRLHNLGYAHSIEVWSGTDLVGGLYGLAIGGFFAAESMFHRQSDASKAALAYLVDRLKKLGFSLLDTQMVTPHTQSLGAIEIPRAHYLIRLRYAVDQDHIRFGSPHPA